jgi:hypothetical protein
MTRDGGLSPEEMDAQDATALPDREAMSTLNPDPSLPALPDVALLDVDANLDLALDVAAPIDAAVAANANVAAPIDAAVSANVLSPDGTSVASAPQDSLISQNLEGEANATANQTAAIGQDGGTSTAEAGAPPTDLVGGDTQSTTPTPTQEP